MQMEIRSHSGVGPIEFGMTRADVKAAMGITPRAFQKGHGARVDAFDDLLIHVYYDTADKAEAVEAGYSAPVAFLGEQVLERPFSQVIQWLQRLDPTIRVDPSGFTSFALGIWIYAPGARDSADEPVEGIIAFRRGYYT